MQISSAVPLIPTQETSFPTATSIGKDPLTRRFLQAAFRVRQFNDIHERAASYRLSLPPGNKRKKRLQNIRKAGVVFVHIPKNAGTSICEQLYGTNMLHQSARYYAHTAPDLLQKLPSFAIWRDPVERFISAYAFARKGGTSRVHIHPDFRAQYSAFTSLDDALDHVENATSPYVLDHVFRPQCWYVCNSQGELLVNKLFNMNMMPKLHLYVPELSGKPVSHLNENRNTVKATPAQKERILRLYAKDVRLGEHVLME